MTAILITLIVASWVAAAIIGTQASLFGKQVKPSYQPIAIPVRSQSATYADRAGYQR
jgi:hypothetical protein